MDRAILSAVLAEMRREEHTRSYADRIEEALKSLFEDIRMLCQAEIDSYISDHISAIFMLKVVREAVDGQLRLLSQEKKAEEQSGTPSLREGCEAAMAYLRRVDNIPNDHMRKAFENAYEKVKAALSTAPDAVCDSVSSAELEDLVAAVKELRDGMCQHCDMRDLCAEGEDGMSTTCNAMAKVKSFIERHERHETNDEAPF